jgi:hypothetical protein
MPQPLQPGRDAAAVGRVGAPAVLDMALLHLRVSTAERACGVVEQALLLSQPFLHRAERSDHF